MVTITGSTLSVSPRVGGLLLIVLGLLFFAIGAYMAYGDYNASSTWKPANATVTYSHLDINKRTSNDGAKYMFEPKITYTYTFDAAAHSGSCCGWSSSDNAEAQRIVDRNAVGKAAPILVNPANPSESRLAEDVSSTGMLIKAAIVLFGIGMAIWGAYGLVKGGNSAPPPAAG